MSGPIINWIDQRFPLSSFVKHDLTDYPTPRNISYWWNFGFLAGIVLVMQVATGSFWRCITKRMSACLLTRYSTSCVM